MVAQSAEPRSDIVFVCGREPGYIRNQMLQRALDSRYRVRVATSAVKPAAWRYVRALGRVTWLLRRSPGLVLVGFYGQPLMPIVRALTRRPVLFDAYLSTFDTLCHDRQWFRPNSIPGRLAYLLDLWSCRWADHVILDTEAHRSYFVDTFGLSPERISVVYVGCDQALFYPRPGLAEGEGSFQVFTYSSYLRLHGVEHILRAAEQLKEFSDIEFTIAGTGRLRPAMQALAQHLDLTNVSFTGWVPFEQLPERIAEADLCLGGHFAAVPKAGRVIATKTFQFLAMGQPTVVGDNHANREVMVHRRHAYLCPMADPTALAGAILELRDSPQLCRRLGAGGYALYRSRFTTEAIGRELESILTRLLP